MRAVQDLDGVAAALNDLQFVAARLTRTTRTRPARTGNQPAPVAASEAMVG